MSNSYPLANIYRELGRGVAPEEVDAMYGTSFSDEANAVSNDTLAQNSVDAPIEAPLDPTEKAPEPASSSYNLGRVATLQTHSESTNSSDSPRRSTTGLSLERRRAAQAAVARMKETLAAKAVSADQATERLGPATRAKRPTKIASDREAFPPAWMYTLRGAKL